jgi:hypothetical protein
MSTGCRVSHCHSLPKVSIVAYYFIRRCANYTIPTYSNAYWPSLQLAYVAQTYPVNGLPFSGSETATATVNEYIFCLCRVFRRMYEFPSKILFNSVSPGTIFWLAPYNLVYFLTKKKLNLVYFLHFNLLKNLLENDFDHDRNTRHGGNRSHNRSFLFAAFSNILSTSRFEYSKRR